MLKRVLGLLTFVTVVAVGNGCRLSSFSIGAYDDNHRGHYSYAQSEYVHHEPAPVHVYSQRGHVCGHGCNDHYFNGVELVVLDGGHRHGAHCGHHWSGSHWKLVAKKSGKSHHHKKHKFKVKKYHH